MQEVILKNVEKDYRSNEAYKTLRTNVEFSGADKKVIVFSSCTPNEGKSTVSLSLAMSLAEGDKNVLFVDADLRKSVLVGRHQIKGQIKGLSHFLSGQADAKDVIAKTQANGLFCVLAGVVPPNPAELLGNRRFEAFIEGAKKAGIKTGVYMFSEAINEEEAREEAKFVLERIKDYDIELPVVLDIEDIAGEEGRNEALSKEELTRVCRVFFDEVKKEGYNTMLYGNIKCLVTMVDLKELKDIDIWYAFYNDDIYIPYEVAGWQYASDGKVDGISGNCDLNIFFKEWD